MELERTGPSSAVIKLNTGGRILFSYDVPVAAFIPGEGYVKADKYFSRTTAAHIARWLEGHEARKISHEALLKLTSEAR